MIEKKELIEIGKFQRPHGLRGELNIISDSDDAVLESLRFIIINVEGIPTPFEIEGFRPKGRSSVLLKFRGIDDADSLRPLVNKPAYAMRDSLPEEYQEEGSFAADIVGFNFKDTAGNISGEVVNVDFQTANVVLTIKGDNGATYLVPLADDLIEIFDPDEQILVMNLPEGIVDL